MQTSQFKLLPVGRSRREIKRQFPSSRLKLQNGVSFPFPYIVGMLSLGFGSVKTNETGSKAAGTMVKGQRLCPRQEGSAQCKAEISGNRPPSSLFGIRWYSVLPAPFPNTC